MKIILDANIFISASFWGGKPRTVLDRVIKNSDTLLITDDIVSEIEKTLRKPKFDLTNDEVESKMADVERLGQKVTVSPEYCATGISRDPDDDKYLECAHAGNADYIITGDGDLLILKEHRSTKIVTPAEYLEIVNF